MKLQELLKTLGLEDDVITKILDGMKTNKIYTASEENLDVRYGKLKAEHDALTEEHGKSTKLIEELQKATKDNEDVQKKITEYEQQIQTLQEEAIRAKAESAVKIGLLSAGAKADDIDYLIFKMQNGSDWKPELDDNGQVKGLDDKIKGLKTQYPAQFEGSSQKKIDENKLPENNDDKKLTKEDFNKMGYQERLKLYNDDPEVYKELSGSKE